MRIMDVKLPGSGESDKMDWQNLERLTPADQVKFVIKDRADYEFRPRSSAARHRSRESPRCCSRPYAVLRSALSGRMDSGGSSRRSGSSVQNTFGQQMPEAYEVNARMPRAVVLLSGGLDSYTAAAVVGNEAVSCALTINYGQRHRREIEAARAS